MRHGMGNEERQKDLNRAFESCARYALNMVWGPATKAGGAGGAGNWGPDAL